MSTDLSKLSLDTKHFDSLMQIQVNDRATVSDVAKVMSKRTLLGRLWAQLKMYVFSGKGWVSPDLLKGLDVRELMRVHEECEGSIIRPFSPEVVADPKIFTDVPLDEESVVSVSTVSDGESSDGVETFDPEVLKKIALIKLIDQAVEQVFADRDEKARQQLAFLNDYSLVDIEENPKLGSFYQIFARENEDSNTLVNFIDFLAEKITNEEFTPLGWVDFNIGINQLKGDRQAVEEWQDRLQSALDLADSEWRGENNAKTLFGRFPAIEERYDAFVDHYCEEVDRKAGLECQEDYSDELGRLQDELKAAEGKYTEAFDLLHELESHQTDYPEKQYELLREKCGIDVTQAQLKMEEAKQKLIARREEIDQLPKTLAQHPESIRQKMRDEKYPFYDEFIDDMIMRRTEGALDDIESDLIDNNGQTVDFINALLANKSHLEAFAQLRVGVEDEKIAHMVQLINTPMFRKEARELLLKMTEGSHAQFSNSFDKLTLKYFELEGEFNREGAEGVYRGKPVVDDQRLFTAMLIASGLDEKESQKLHAHLLHQKGIYPDDLYVKAFLSAMEWVRSPEMS